MLHKCDMVYTLYEFTLYVIFSNSLNEAKSKNDSLLRDKKHHRDVGDN